MLHKKKIKCVYNYVILKQQSIHTHLLYHISQLSFLHKALYRNSKFEKLQTL